MIKIVIVMIRTKIRVVNNKDNRHYIKLLNNIFRDLILKIQQIFFMIIQITSQNFNPNSLVLQLKTDPEC